MSEPRPRTLLHADMDAFYASIEQRDRPDLLGRPVIVGGTGRRGVVSAASYEARRFGVHSAMPTAQARVLCPQGVFLRGDMARYARESRRIFAIFERFTPLVEGLSLDEAFLDVTGTERLFGPPRELASRLRREVRQETGLAVSIGIAPVKLVAKIASDLAKPDGLLEVEPGALREFLDPLPVGRLWGVGAVAEARLRAAGLSRVGDLARADSAQLAALLGRFGPEVARLARGEDPRAVDPDRAPVSMSEENTFEQDVSDPEVLVAAALTHAESVARRLRSEGLLARTLVVKLKLGRRRAPGPRGFALRTRRVTLAEPSDDGAVLFEAARGLLRAHPPSEPIRLIGVGVSGLCSTADRQLGLFADRAGLGERAALNRALDALAERFGPRAVVRAGQAPVERAGLTLQRKRGASVRGDADPEA
jgi:DNA polymerase-4